MYSNWEKIQEVYEKVGGRGALNLLNQLISSQRRTKLLSRQDILSSYLKTALSSTKCTPADSISGSIETSEGATKSLGIRKIIRTRYMNIIHEDHASSGCPKRKLPINLRSSESFHFFIEDESSDIIVII